MLNTIKTTINFFSSIIRRYFQNKSKDNSIEDILNYFKYSDMLSSSGQPSKDQVSLIQDAGYKTIINLAPYDTIEAPLKNEENIVTTLGMRYIHIPVNFFNPTNEDFERFVKALDKVSDQKTWIHCAANARASAFVFRYRCTILGMDAKAAIWDLREIWEPFGVWKKFVFNDSNIVIKR